MLPDDQAKKIRNELAEELKKDLPDSDLILRLSNDLVDLDENHVRFSIDAGHISRIGKELVGKAETAVAELIKNAFDADASKVTVAFQGVETKGGTLTIVDNGLGMTREEIVNGFMRLSTSDKVDNPVSKKYGRAKAGRKGIGRFSTQRLGNKLTLVTQTESDNFALQVSFDWKAYAKGAELSFIKNRIKTIEKKRHSGTKLIIEKLNDEWKDSQIKRVYRYSLDLVQPFPLSKTNLQNDIDPGFKAVFKKDGEVVADEETMIFKHALAVIEGEVNGEGQGSWQLKSEKLDISESNMIGAPDSQDKYKHIKDIKFKVYYFIYRAGLMPTQVGSSIENISKERGGIRVYRNGFCVRPYGERYDDWLRLDQSSRGREIIPAHANMNFFGFVEIIDPDGLMFEETSSREGLIENEAFEELQYLLFTVLRSAALRIAAIRGRKQTPSQKGWEKKDKPYSPEDKARETAQKLFKEAESASDSKSDSQYDDSKVDAQDTAETIIELLDIIGMLRVLASLGLTIGEFAHEVKHYVPAALLDLDSAKALSSGDCLNILDRINKNLKTISAYSSYFDSAVSANVSRERVPQDLRNVIRVFLNTASPLLKRTGIDIHKDIKGYDLYTTPMHESEWASILQNLFSNSKKAIRKADVEGEILIRAGMQGDITWLEFADNGIGIPEENEDRIFDAFFTTSQPLSLTSDEQDDMLGSGLGLKLVNDIISAVNGDVYITTPPKGYKTCVRIETPKAKEEEVPDD